MIKKNTIDMYLVLKIKVADYYSLNICFDRLKNEMNENSKDRKPDSAKRSIIKYDFIIADTRCILSIMFKSAH